MSPRIICTITTCILSLLASFVVFMNVNTYCLCVSTSKMLLLTRNAWQLSVHQLTRGAVQLRQQQRQRVRARASWQGHQSHPGGAWAKGEVGTITLHTTNIVKLSLPARPLAREIASCGAMSTTMAAQ